MSAPKDNEDFNDDDDDDTDGDCGAATEADEKGRGDLGEDNGRDDGD